MHCVRTSVHRGLPCDTNIPAVSRSPLRFDDTSRLSLSNMEELNKHDTCVYLFNCRYSIAVVLNLFHCWDPLNATDVVWDPQVKIEKVCAPE